MSDLWDKVISEAKKVSLTKEEKFSMLEIVRQRMDNPVVEPVIMTSKVKTPYFSYFSFNFTWHEKRFVPIAVILIVVIFGGTAFAANGALPGDVLYSMKVNVNEKVESWGALSPNALARFEAVKAERRLKEIEKITIQKKKISPEVKAQVKDNLDKSIQKVKEVTAEIAANGDVDAAVSVKAELESKLEAHSVVLGKLSTDNEVEKITEVDDEDKAGIKDINDLVDAHIDDLKVVGDEVVTEEVKNDNTESSDGKNKEQLDEKAENSDVSTSKEEKTETIDESGTTMTDITSITETAPTEPTLFSEKQGDAQNIEGEKSNKSEKAVVEKSKDNKEDQQKNKKELKNKGEKVTEKSIDNPKLKAEVKSILKELDLPTED